MMVMMMMLVMMVMTVLMIIMVALMLEERRLRDIPGIWFSLQFPFVLPRGQIEPCTHQIMMKMRPNISHPNICSTYLDLYLVAN